MIFRLFLFLLCSFSVDASPLLEGELSKSELAVVLTGKVLVKEATNEDGILGLVAACAISSTRVNIWNTLVDYDNFTKIFSDVERVSVLNESKEGALIEFWVDAVLADLNYTIYRQYDTLNGKISWQRMSGDLQTIEGSWEIVDIPTDENKIVIYRSFVEVGQLVPTKLIRWGAMGKAEEMCLNLKKWIEGISDK